MTKIDDMCDVMLSLDDPDFAEQLRDAIGANAGESIEIVTPQFERTDGLQVPRPLIDFAKLPTLHEDTLKSIGCQKWDEPENGSVLWLYPAEWYDLIPDGTPIVSISGSKEVFKRGETDDDRRFGALSFGFLRAA